MFIQINCLDGKAKFINVNLIKYYQVSSNDKKCNTLEIFWADGMEQELKVKDNQELMCTLNTIMCALKK